MNNRAKRYVRWATIFGLWSLIGILFPPTWILHALTGGGLWIVGWARAEAKRLGGP